MRTNIQILQNGHPQTTLQLGNGTYTLGRASDADILLADSAVSKNHAILTIEDNHFQIKDNSSANGTFFQGKKISEQSFKDNFEIAIKPFTIRADNGSSKNNRKVQLIGDAVGTFSINNIRLSLFLIFGITMLLTVLIGYFPLKKQATTIVRQEFFKTGILLARYLAEINRPFLEDGQNNLVRTTPVRLEDGVIYAFVLDPHGRIIAPHEKQGDFVNWDGLTDAFTGAKIKIEDGKQNEKIIFYPVVQQNKIIGATMIGFAWQQASQKKISGMAVTAFFVLAVLLCVSLIVCHLLAKAFIGPLNTLYEEVELAIKKGKTSLAYKAPYQELDNLKRAFDRLLMRKTSIPPSAPGKTETGPNGPETITKPAAGKEKIPIQATTDFPVSSADFLAELSTPWCIIDRENYSLVQFSNNFSPGPGTPECKEGMHIIEALETEIIPAVSQIIDSDSTDEIATEHAGKALILRRMNIHDADANGKNKIILVFEDKAE